MRCGEMCGGCHGRCVDEPTQDNPAMLECPVCNGTGCDACRDGMFSMHTCPKKFVGYEITEACNAAAIAEKGLWPVVGGSLDQSAWFVDFVQCLASETNRIDNERARRGYSD